MCPVATKIKKKKKKNSAFTDKSFNTLQKKLTYLKCDTVVHDKIQSLI